MPAALQRQLHRHRKALANGVRRACRSAARESHPQGSAPPDHDAASLLARSLARITALLDSQAPMDRVVAEMGVAASRVWELSNPFRAAPGDAEVAAYAGRFASYVEEHLADLRVVFKGYTDPLLEENEMAAFGRRLAGRSRSYLDDLIGAFRRFDETGDPLFLDQRSVPFGVASLSYSRSVTDTARAWLHAWRRAHGDLRGLPYPLLPPADPAAEARKSRP